jgi:hypothetical protein
MYYVELFHISSKLVVLLNILFLIDQTKLLTRKPIYMSRSREQLHQSPANTNYNRKTKTYI